MLHPMRSVPQQVTALALALAIGLGLSLGSAPASALMVGMAPDTPQAHVDPNRNDSPWSSAVAVIANGGTYSGVMVSPRHVLTAEHVVGTRPAAEVAVQVNLGESPRRHAVVAVARFPSASFPYDDLALLTLDSAVDADVRIVPVLRSAPPAGTELILVGYGASGAGDQGPSVAALPGVKRVVRNRVDAVQPSVDGSGRRSLFYLYDFDGPSGPGSLGGPSMGNSIEGSLASGDSGSPAFATIDGQRVLVGINNLVAPPPGETANSFRFGTVCGGMLLSDSRFITWLENQTQGSLGQQPPREGEAPLPPWTLGLLLAGVGASMARRRRQQAARAATAAAWVRPRFG